MIVTGNGPAAVPARPAWVAAGCGHRRGVVQELPDPRRQRSVLLFSAVACPSPGRWQHHPDSARFWYTSAYVADASENADLVDALTPRSRKWPAMRT